MQEWSAPRQEYHFELDHALCISFLFFVPANIIIFFFATNLVGVDSVFPNADKLEVLELVKLQKAFYCVYVLRVRLV